MSDKQIFANRTAGFNKESSKTQESRTDALVSCEDIYSLEAINYENVKVSQQQKSIKQESARIDYNKIHRNYSMELNRNAFALHAKSQEESHKSRSMVYRSFINFEKQLASHKQLCQELMEALDGNSFKYKYCNCKPKTNKNCNKSRQPGIPTESWMQIKKSQTQQQNCGMLKRHINTDHSEHSLKNIGSSDHYMTCKERNCVEDTIKQLDGAKTYKNVCKARQSKQLFNVENVENSPNPSFAKQIIDSDCLYEKSCYSDIGNNVIKTSNFHCPPFLKYSNETTASKNDYEDKSYHLQQETMENFAIAVDGNLPCSSALIVDEISQFNDISHKKSFFIKHRSNAPKLGTKCSHHNTNGCCENTQIYNFSEASDEINSSEKSRFYDEIQMDQILHTPYSVRNTNDLSNTKVRSSVQARYEGGSSKKSRSFDEIQMTRMSQVYYNDKNICIPNNSSIDSSVQVEGRQSKINRSHSEPQLVLIPGTPCNRKVKKDFKQFNFVKHSLQPEFDEAYHVSQFKNIVEMGDPEQIYRAARTYKKLNPIMAPYLQQILNSFHYLKLSNSNNINSIRRPRQTLIEHQCNLSEKITESLECVTEENVNSLKSNEVFYPQFSNELHTEKEIVSPHIFQNHNQSKGVQTTASLYICKCGRSGDMIGQLSQSQETLRRSESACSNHSNDTIKNINLEILSSFEDLVNPQEDRIIFLTHSSNDSMNYFENCCTQNTSSIFENSSTTNPSDLQEGFNSEVFLKYANINDIQEADYSSSMHLATSSSVVYQSASNNFNSSSDYQSPASSVDGNQLFHFNLTNPLSIPTKSALLNETVSPILTQLPYHFQYDYMQLRQRHRTKQMKKRQNK